MALILLLLLLLLLLLTAHLRPSNADKILVGGDFLWSTAINYTHWSSLHHFHVGDQLYFVSEKRVGIYRTSRRSFWGCRRGQKLHQRRCAHTIGDLDLPPKYCVSHVLKVPGRFFFTAANRSACRDGMKVAVTVEVASGGGGRRGCGLIVFCMVILVLFVVY